MRCDVGGRRGSGPPIVTTGIVSSVVLSIPSDSLGVAQTLQLTATGRDAAGVPVTGRPVTWTSSDTTIAKDVRRAPFDSLGNVAGATVIAHDVMHNLGLGHSCGLPSVMSYCNTFSLAQPLSVEDVAYIRLGQLIRRRMAETGSSYGLIEAMRGERVVELQLPYVWS